MYIETFFMKFWYDTDLRIIKIDTYLSHLNNMVIMQIIELYKNYLNYDMEVCLSTPFLPYA